MSLRRLPHLPLFRVVLLRVFFLILSTHLGTGCSERGTPGALGWTSKSTPKSVSASVPPAGAPALKTADQLWNSYLALTGLAPEHFPNPQAFVVFTNSYRLLKPQLPGVNEAGAFAPGQQIAINKLAALFCDQLVDLAKQVTLNPGQIAYKSEPVLGLKGADLNQAADQVLETEAKRKAMVSAIINRFWGPPEQERLPDREASIADLTQVLGELYSTPSSTPNLAANLAKAACMAVLASLPVTLQ